MKKMFFLIMLFPTLLFAQSQTPPQPNQRAIEGPVAPGLPIENEYIMVLMLCIASVLVFNYLKKNNFLAK